MGHATFRLSQVGQGAKEGERYDHICLYQTYYYCATPTIFVVSLISLNLLHIYVSNVVCSILLEKFEVQTEGGS